MIKITKMSYLIPSGNLILKDVSLDVKEGDYKGILGRNGAGKTTLIDLMMGFRRPSKGSVSVFETDPFLSSRRIYSEISYLAQDVHLKDNITIKEFLNFHRHFFKNYSQDDQLNLMNTFQLDESLKIGGLSTGQKRRVQIVSALAARPKILFIDEITAVLDPESRKIFFDLLKKINSDYGTAILIATNIVDDLKGKVQSVFFIDDKNVSEQKVESIDALFERGVQV